MGRRGGGWKVGGGVLGILLGAILWAIACPKMARQKEGIRGKKGSFF